MTRPALKVVRVDAPAPARSWRPKRHQVIGSAVAALGVAMAVWLYVHPLDLPKITAVHTTLALLGIWVVAKFVEGWRQPQRKPD